ncbi:flagellar type III secretion system pore protein FliP [Actinomarinicola tropica]|uniref:Flagellar biosynthetic protein FliP n=1 Tax=Actinomarinicola tropica TaxID=2789776 RepID=A0A5Q2RN85_9ACTN|nr:flagellar type III secretion system pore protein FliP [Actinomarinicola tropica]QGG94655.1 flagellar type III secretion system pore protein FliP [Actinomarinicola tropica]
MSRRIPALIAAVVIALALGLVLPAAPAAAQDVPGPDVPAPPVPGAPTPDEPEGPSATIDIDLSQGEAPSQSIVIILGLTVLSVAPSILILTTSFTRMVVVLSLTRNALGVQTIPPNQVVIGLALFLSLFVMAPTLSEMNEEGLQPLLAGELSQGEAFEAASAPLKEFMLANTREGELQMIAGAAGDEVPEQIEDLPLTTVAPAFVLSELKSAFIIGFVIFVPFLVIDLVVSAVLMSLGMMMLPPVFVSLPFKILLFVMVDGWSLIARTLLESYR